MLNPTRSLRRPRPADRRRTHGAGLGRPLRRREGAAHHPGLLREASLPERADSGDRRPRVVRLIHPGLRLRRPERGQLRAHLPGARARGFGHPQFRLGAELAVHVSDLRLRQRGAEAEVAARHGARPEDRLLRPHRTARRVRPVEHEDARRRRKAATGSSTARRCGSPTAPSPTSASAGR